MLIAKIVSSNSHIDYVARVVDSFDNSGPPGPEDAGFGKFVLIPLGEALEAVGVVFNSMLVNPEYSDYGPRLSPKPDLSNFSPDYLNEQGVLISILLVGYFDSAGQPVQKIPGSVLTAGSEVFDLPDEKFEQFHRDGEDSLIIHYYSQINSRAGSFASPLLESIFDRLNSLVDHDEQNRLNVLRQNLLWQRTIGEQRL